MEGIPHQLMEDDVYRGMSIPKGSTVIANIRCVTLVPPTIPPQVNEDQPVEAWLWMRRLTENLIRSSLNGFSHSLQALGNRVRIVYLASEDGMYDLFISGTDVLTLNASVRVQDSIWQKLAFGLCWQHFWLCLIFGPSRMNMGTMSSRRKSFIILLPGTFDRCCVFGYWSFWWFIQSPCAIQMFYSTEVRPSKEIARISRWRGCLWHVEGLGHPGLLSKVITPHEKRFLHL